MTTVQVPRDLLFTALFHVEQARIPKGGRNVTAEKLQALLAAAPQVAAEPVNQQLLEALKRSLNWLASYPGGNAENTYDQARAAIAAAEAQPAEPRPVRSDSPEADAAIEALRKRVQAQDAALDFAAGFIGDAIYTEGDFDGDTGQRILHIITEAKERGEFDKAKYGDLDHLCPFERAERAEAELAAAREDAERYRWLRSSRDDAFWACHEKDGYGGQVLKYGVDLDAAIDAYLAGGMK